MEGQIHADAHRGDLPDWLPEHYLYLACIQSPHADHSRRTRRQYSLLLGPVAGAAGNRQRRESTLHPLHLLSARSIAGLSHELRAARRADVSAATVAESSCHVQLLGVRLIRDWGMGCLLAWSVSSGQRLVGTFGSVRIQLLPVSHIAHGQSYDVVFDALVPFLCIVVCH